MEFAKLVLRCLLPDARLVHVPGGHFGPRDEEEEQLLVWATRPRRELNPAGPS